MPATYTTRLRELVRSNEDIGLYHYPIFDETYRETLNEKIINNYLMREIGCETPEIFSQRMHTRMCNIMPIYNQMYVVSQREIDPFTTVSMETITAGSSTGKSSQEDTATGENTSGNEAASRAIVSQYPQSRLAGHEDYATSGTDSESKSNSVSNNESKANSHVESEGDSRGNSFTTGQDRPIWEIVSNLTNSFINIDLMIVGELDDMFMQLHTNNDETYQRDGIFYPSLFGVRGFGGMSW